MSPIPTLLDMEWHETWWEWGDDNPPENFFHRPGDAPENSKTLAALSSNRFWTHSRWRNLSIPQRSMRWQRLLPQMGIRCSLKPAYFWYPSLNMSIRGVTVNRNTSAGDVLCKIPERAAITELTIANSSLQPIQEYARSFNLEGVSMLILFVLRETVRRKSRWAPYLQESSKRCNGMQQKLERSVVSLM